MSNVQIPLITDGSFYDLLLVHPKLITFCCLQDFLMVIMFIRTQLVASPSLDNIMFFLWLAYIIHVLPRWNHHTQVMAGVQKLCRDMWSEALLIPLTHLSMDQHWVPKVWHLGSLPTTPGTLEGFTNPPQMAKKVSLGFGR